MGCMVFKGMVSGLLWSLVPIFVFGQHFGRYHIAWMLVCGSLTGIVVTSLLRFAKVGLTRRLRMISCVPVVFLGEALWAFFLTLPITQEGNWPGRWLELVFAIYYTNVLGLFLLAFAPLAYLNIAWVVGSVRVRER